MEKIKDSLVPIKLTYPPVPAREFSCATCKHINEWNGEYTCKAFPNGIPDQILNGENKHTKPTKSQENKIVFEEIK